MDTKAPATFPFMMMLVSDAPSYASLMAVVMTVERITHRLNMSQLRLQSDRDRDARDVDETRLGERLATSFVSDTGK